MRHENEKPQSTLMHDGLENPEEKLDEVFLAHAADVLADTSNGMTGTYIVQHCNAYAVKFKVKIPITSANFGRFGSVVPNKRTALMRNLKAFSAAQQYLIIKELCELPMFVTNDDAQKLRISLITQYAVYSTDKLASSELIVGTKHWLKAYPMSLHQYNNALLKFEAGIYERNVLDDMRLAFELLVKGVLKNEKSIENNMTEIGGCLKEKGVSPEIRNMCTYIIRYYMDFQNNNVKHNDRVNENEIEYIIELTSVLMKFLIKTCGG